LIKETRAGLVGEANVAFSVDTDTYCVVVDGDEKQKLATNL
jgi:hypothetical protein